MSDHRHATDRKETKMNMGCPNGCEFGVELEAEGTNDSIDKLTETLTEEFGECPQCGTSLGSIKQESPSEVLD